MKTKFYPLLLSIVAIVLFSNCESNTEDIIPDPITETPIEETPTLLTSLSFEETYAFEANLMGGPHKENNVIVYCISKTSVDDAILTV